MCFREPELAERSGLFVRPAELRPLPTSLQGLACERCGKCQAKWEFFSSDLTAGARRGEPVCALCWLYKSEWVAGKREDIDRLIVAVEEERGEVFRRTEDGCLWACADADRILAGIAFGSRQAEYVKKLSQLEVLGG